MDKIDDVSGLTLLGNGAMSCPGEPGAKILETFPNRFDMRPYIINISFPEFTSLCPVTGQPDFGTIEVDYIPDKLCVESKSFKLYMFAFRNHKSFMETITNTILDDFVNRLDPCWCQVKGLFAPRGATRLHVFCEHYKDIEKIRKDMVASTVKSWRLEISSNR